MTPIRRITVDLDARIYEVVDMYDAAAEPTDDPTRAVSCVIALPDGRYWSTDATDVPIYTVH